MANDNVNTIEQLYVAYFGRPADPNGLDYWTKAMDANPGALQQVSAQFAASQEYQSMYTNMDSHATVEAVYQNLFGRAGDDAGVAFWTHALDSGGVSIDHLVTEFVNGAQGSDKTVFSARVDAALAFDAHLDTAADISAYSGSAAIQIARAFIGAIVDDPSAAIAENPVTIDTTIIKIVGTATGGPITVPPTV